MKGNIGIWFENARFPGKKKDESKVGFLKRLLVVNRRSKSNSSTNCANYETASDVRFRFNSEPINNFVRIRKRKKERKKKWREQLCQSYAGRERYLSLKRVARKSVGTNAKRPRNSIYPMFRAHGRIKFFISISLPNFLWCPDHLVPIGAYKPPRNGNEIDRLGSLRDPNCIPCIDTEPPERRKEREEREERERKNHAIWFQSTHIQKKRRRKKKSKK